MEIDAEKANIRDALLLFGKVIVEAAPGTGKTFTGVYLAREAQRSGWIKGKQKALLLTFSRNARIQIEEEVDRFVSAKELIKEEFNSICVSNYHSFYFEILQKKRGFWGVGKFCPATIDEEKAQNSSVEEGRAGIKRGTPRYNDFSKLIFQLLKNSPTLLLWLQAKYPFVVLDEFQDTDSIQWEILKLWKPKQVAVFYDRFQMIHEFRGADLNNIQKIIDAFQIPNSAQKTLTVNYRVGSKNSLYGYISELRQDELGGAYISTINPRQWLSIRPCDSVLMPKLFLRCVTKIRSISRSIDFNESTAIITSTNSLANSLQKNLTKKPSGRLKWYCSCRKITGDEDASEELRNLLKKIRVCRNDKELRGSIGIMFNNMLLSNNAICFKKEFKKNKIDVLKGKRGLLKTMHVEYQVFCDEVVKNNFQGIAKLLDFVLKHAVEYVKEQSKLDPDWKFFIHKFARITKFFPSSGTWNDYCDALENEILIQNHFRRKETKGVTILNAHQSKGRQFDHVILPWLSDNGESATNDFPGKKYDYQDHADRRLLYVALTRAKKRVTIIYPGECPARILREWKLI